MSDAFDTVKAMEAEAKQGHTPALLRKFLRRAFPRPLRRLLFFPCSYEVSRIEPFPDGGFFRASCVFWVFARDRILDAPVLPSGGSFGLFALGAGGFRCLSQQRRHFERLLREEGRPLEECDSLVLASLLAKALLRQGSISHDVLESADLSEYRGGLGRFGGGYQLDVREWERVRARVIAPAISGDAGTGWRLDFCSVVGWMHQKQTLVRHLFRFRPDFRMSAWKRVLSRRIFERTPSIMY